MRKLTLFTLLLVIHCFVASLPAQDQETEEPAAYRETVTVTADRIEEPVKDAGSSVSVITRAEIEKRRTPFVSDLLRDVPGVQISQSGAIGKATTVFLRGAGSSQSLVMMDGVQINDSLNFVDLANLSTNNVERIEIVRGAQGTLYGSDAMGGVINIITRSAGELISARAEAGSDSTFNGSIRSGFGSDRNNFSLEYSRYETDGEIQNDDYENGTLSLNTHVQVTQWTNLGFLYRDTESDLGIPFNVGVPSPDRRQKTHLSLLHFPLKQEIREWWTAEAHFSTVDVDLEFKDPHDLFGFTFSNSESRTTTFQLVNTFRVDRQTIIGGYEHEKIRVNEVSPYTSLQNAEVTNHAVYAQYQFSPWKPLTLTTGFRVDDHSAFGSDINPRLAVSYRLSKTLRLHGTAATGFRAPKPAELTGPYGNANLRPEEVKSWDLGIDLEILSPNFLVSGTVFRNDFDSLIGFDLSTYRLKNFEKVESSGIEFETRIRPSSNLLIVGSYTLLNTENKLSREELLRRPKNSGSIAVDYRWKKVDINLHWNIVGKRFDIDEMTYARTANEGFHRADLVAGYDFTDELQAYCRITNAFDNQYQEVFGYPAPDRGIFTGIRFRY